MDIGNFKELVKGVTNNYTFSNMVSNFIKELSKALEKSSNNIEIKEGDINIVYGIFEEKVTLLNPETGKEQEIYISTSDEVKDKLQNKGIYDNIYETEKETFYSWNLGTKLIMQDGKLNKYMGEIEVKDDEAWYKLDDLYSSMKADEGKNFIVKEVTNNKVILNYEEGGGFVSRPKQLYPSFKVGDIVKYVNNKFIKD